MTTLDEMVYDRLGAYLDRNARCETCVFFSPDLFGNGRCENALYEVQKDDRCEAHYPTRSNRHIGRGIQAICSLYGDLLPIDRS
jgi:hypothetical protein